MRSGTPPGRKRKAPARTPGEPSVFDAVHALVRRIPRGRVATYGQLSQLIGERLSPVGIGWALHAPAAEHIPWYRVVNGRGGISTDHHTPGRQRMLLETEGVKFDGAGRIDLATYQWRPKRV